MSGIPLAIPSRLPIIQYMRRSLLPAVGVLVLAACGSSPRPIEPAPPVAPPPGAPEAPEAPNRIDPPEAMPPAEDAFVWPVRGTVAERRGAAGIGIRASGDVVAVKSGRVQILLSAWHGRRNLITLRHADGFLSEYSDVDEILVPIGRAVRQGDPVARLRSGGTVQFRLYRETQALDPTRFLP